MARGRQTRTLRPDQIQRLEKFRRASHEGAPHGYSLPQLRLAMGAQFSWETLKNALQGRAVWDLYYSYIAQWIDRYLPATPLRDGKVASAGDAGDEPGEPNEPVKNDEPNTEEAGAARTVRGSR